MSISKQLRQLYYTLPDLRRLERKVVERRETLRRERPAVVSPVVSLTTVPNRIAYLKPTLVSLLRQRLPPREIHLNLGRDLFREVELPSFLKGLEVVRPFWVERDVGPATKYIPTLERFEGTQQPIVVVDDDMVYSDRLLEDLMEADERLHGRCVVCANGSKVPDDLDSASLPSEAALSSGQRRVAIVEGCGGYTLHPGLVSPASLRDLTGAPARSLFDDDIWLSGHLSRAGVRKYQVATGKRRSVVNTLTSAISGDRRQLQTDVMRFFSRDWMVDEIEPT